MNKLTLNEFREIKNSMMGLIKLLEQRYNSESQGQFEKEKFLMEYSFLQDRLLSSDLSDVPFEEWQGLFIFADGELDLSKTHANIDFSLLADIVYDSINLHGCNVRGIQVIDYDEDTFDAEYMKEHPEYFPDESIPYEIRKLFYDKKLAFSDLIEYPALRKCVNERSFERGYSSPSHELIRVIGFENAIKLFDESPNFVGAITFEEKRDSYSSGKFNFRTAQTFVETDSYEASKQFVYKRIIDEVKQGYSNFPSFDVIPKEMIDSFPNVFIKEGELPNSVIEDYYDGVLSIEKIRRYSEVLKTKDLEIGTHSSKQIRAINKVFGDVWNFLERVPIEYDNIVGSYLSNNAYNDEKVSQIAQQELSNIISDSIRYALSGNAWSRYNLDQLYGFSQYVSIEEIFEESSLRNFVQRCGFENIVEFNRNNNMILERTEDSYSSVTLLQKMAKYANLIGEDVLITNEQQLSNIFGQIIHQMRSSDDFSARKLLTKSKRELSTLYPNEFLDYNALDDLLKDMDEKNKEQFIERLENGFNGDTNSLLEFLNENPFLLPALANKSLIISKNEWRLNDCYEQVGSERFLDICSKYGKSIALIFASLDYYKMSEFISQINGDNYEQQINQYIYNSLGKKGGRNFDIRILPQSFKSEHPELYLAENSPKELQDVFYGKNYLRNDYSLLEAKDIQEHPEWIPFLMKVDLIKCLNNQNVANYNSKSEAKNGYAYPQQMNLYKALGLKFSKEEILQFISKYGHCLSQVNLLIDVSLEKEEQYELLIKSIYTSIKNRRIIYNNTHMPKEFIEKYPDIFLDENAPEELQNVFYQRKISPEIIQNHPEWKHLLRGKDIGASCDMNVISFVRTCEQLGFNNDKIFELFEKYGSYIAECQVNINNVNSNNIAELDNVIRQQIAEAIIVKRVRYNESARAILGGEYPELFLDENVPEELKKYFYNSTNNSPLTFELLKQHKEWLPFIQDKNVLLSLKKRNIGVVGLENLFERYGQEQALKIGMRNPESVMKMLEGNKFELLSQWYDKLNFIPHYVVMLDFPFEQSDKFVASGKKWSQLMRIERHSLNEESKSAFLKASMCFGVFDNDVDGFNKVMQLFTDIPRTLTESDMNSLVNSLARSEELARLEKESNEEYLNELEILKEIYRKNDDGTYTLKINSQQHKYEVNVVRGFMERTGFTKVLSPEQAHKMFGGFEMKYNPEFRDFLLQNMEEILNSDNISYMSSIQKQWSGIKALNSNRTLTLDMALAFVKSYSYQDVEVGNEKLAEVSNNARYSQQDFDTLQQIYNYGKQRIFSSVPRVQGVQGDYIYEILRLDDPLAVAIGTLSDCCQELGNAAETCMEHSMVNKHGRVFVIKNQAGEIVAQSWVWRNNNVICFDNIEVPDKQMFSHGIPRGMENFGIRNEFTDEILSIYQRAAQEMVEIDEKTYSQLLEEGKITQEQYERLVLRKVTTGEGYSNIKGSFVTLEKDDTLVGPAPFEPPVELSRALYTNDSKTTQYILSGERGVETTGGSTPTLYQDEFAIYDNANTKEQDLLLLQKLECITKKDNYLGRTQTEETENIISDIAYNYNLNPETTRVIMNANFAIIYDIREDSVVLGDVLYNTNVNIKGQQIDITDKVAMQIRMAIEQIGEKSKKLDISRLDLEQLKMCSKAMNLDEELDVERGLSHGAR